MPHIRPRVPGVADRSVHSTVTLGVTPRPTCHLSHAEPSGHFSRDPPGPLLATPTPWSGTRSPPRGTVRAPLVAAERLAACELVPRPATFALRATSGHLAHGYPRLG